MKKAMLAFLLFMFQSATYAGGALVCENEESQLGMTQCFSKAASQLDIKVENIIRTFEKDNPAGCVMCVLASFRSYREAACNFHKTSVGQGSMASLAKVHCDYRLTEKFLEDVSIFRPTVGTK
jgi:uncharacterized protein YecT (DUF1311 family)